MTSNTEIVKRWFKEVWCEPHNPKVIDELMAEDCCLYGISGGDILSRDGFKALHNQILKKYPDIHIEVTHTVESGEFLAYHAKATATHAKSSNPVNFAGTGITKIQGGVIVESNETWDFVSLFAQIGALSPEVIARELGGPAE